MPLSPIVSAAGDEHQADDGCDGLPRTGGGRMGLRLAPDV
jgi:hypothetical protein